MSDAPSVVGIGNALVDVISHETDAFVEAQGIVKGSMNLVESDRSAQLYDLMGPGVEISGGSAANTMVGVASFGTSAVYLGKVRNDQLGEVFLHDMKASGVPVASAPSQDGSPTGRCLILVTPDAERTLNTYLGASVEMGPDDVDTDLVAAAKAVYLEGYLWDRPKPMAAMRLVADTAADHDVTVTFTLSDSFCVDRHRESFRTLINERVDVLFANRDEILALYEVNTVDEAVARIRSDGTVATITLGPRGSMVVTRDEVVQVPAVDVPKVLDTTGAGDLYASGYLHGLVTGEDPARCATLGNLAAAEVITHIGARPERKLSELAGGGTIS